MDDTAEIIIGILALSACFLFGLYLGMTSDRIVPIYETNQAKYEIKFAKCLAYPKGNVKDCHEVAVFNSQMCVRGCE